MAFFSAHFKAALLAFVSGLGGDDPSHLGRAGKGHEADGRVRDERRASGLPVTGHEVDDARRQPGFLKGLDKAVHRKRRILGGFDDHRVAAQDRRQNFPRGDGDGEIPGSDEPAHTDGIPDGHGKLVGQFGGGRLPVEPPSFTGDEVGHVNGFLGVAAGFLEHFAHFPGHVVGDGFLVTDENFAHPEDVLGTLGWWNKPPPGVGFGGGGHGRFDVLGRRVGKVADDVAGVGRVVVGKDFTVFGSHPGALDVVGIGGERSPFLALVTVFLAGVDMGMPR